MKIKITGGCYEYWYRDYSKCIFEAIREDEDNYWVVLIDSVTYPNRKQLNILFDKYKELPVAKYDAELFAE